MMRSVRLLAASALIAGILSGCGNSVTTDIVGMAAVARADDGSPVLLIKVCKGDIDTVGIYAFRDGLSADQPNRPVASWTADHATGNAIELPVNDPPEGWRPSPSTPGTIPMAGNRGFIVLAQSSTTDSEVTQVSFRNRELQGLAPSQVLVRDSQVSTRTQFDHDACS